MTLTIEFTPSEEKRVTDAARQKGLVPADFVKLLVAEYLVDASENDRITSATAGPIGIDPTHFYFTATREEFNDALDEIARMNDGLPILGDDAFDRENLYQ